MRTEPDAWRAELRALFDESFDYDWQEHLRQRNARFLSSAYTDLESHRRRVRT